MNHAITWASLFGVGFILTGLVAIGGGILAFLAGSMSDDPQAGDSSASAGALAVGAGLVIGSLGIWLVL